MSFKFIFWTLSTKDIILFPVLASVSVCVSIVYLYIIFARLYAQNIKTSCCYQCKQNTYIKFKHKQIKCLYMPYRTNISFIYAICFFENNKIFIPKRTRRMCVYMSYQCKIRTYKSIQIKEKQINSCCKFKM